MATTRRRWVVGGDAGSLVVDDEPQILRAMRINLRARGYDVDVAAGRRHRAEAAAARPPDLVVLDLGLPDMEGIEVIRGLRGWTAVPIIVLSGRADSADKVAALDAGADDYVTKPFGVDELLARIRAVTRRIGAAADATPVVTVGGVHRRPRRPRTVDRRRAVRSGSPRPSGTCWRSCCATPASWSASGNCSRRCGGRSTRPRPTTSASTWPSCGASSRPTRRTRGTCSPNRGWATASRPE